MPKRTSPIPSSKFVSFVKAKHAFAARVIAVVRDIPRGETMTYGQVAYKAGYPGAARAVGNVMRHVNDPSVPFYRVVSASGKDKSPGALRRAALRAKEL